jgi:hypothetical protein
MGWSPLRRAVSSWPASLPRNRIFLVILIRKYKRFYDKMHHTKIAFQNWKGQEETLTVLKNPLAYAGKLRLQNEIPGNADFAILIH